MEEDPVTAEEDPVTAEENPVAIEEEAVPEDFGLLVDHPPESTPTSRKRLLSPDTIRDLETDDDGNNYN